MEQEDNCDFQNWAWCRKRSLGRLEKHVAESEECIYSRKSDQRSFMQHTIYFTHKLVYVYLWPHLRMIYVSMSKKSRLTWHFKWHQSCKKHSLKCYVSSFTGNKEDWFHFGFDIILLLILWEFPITQPNLTNFLVLPYMFSTLVASSTKQNEK